jgi:hypothetical protein
MPTKPVVIQFKEEWGNKVKSTGRIGRLLGTQSKASSADEAIRKAATSRDIYNHPEYEQYGLSETDKEWIVLYHDNPVLGGKSKKSRKSRKKRINKTRRSRRK